MSELVLFEQKQVRRVWHGEAWWFVIVDVVAALTDSANPAGYLKDMRRRDPALGGAFQGGGNLPPPWPQGRDRGRDSGELIFTMLGEASTTEIARNVGAP
jgi:hypothetical protein